ncbi:MAG: peptidyl-prolyl cis-trans isomerase [Pseudomonadota bacterium]
MAKSGGFKVSNILVWTLLALLILALAGFGVGGFGGQVRSIGQVGQTDISLQSYARSLEAELRTIQQQTGQPLSFPQAEQIGLTQQVLQQQVGRASLEEAARLAGISVGDQVVADRVRTEPAFQGLTGGFDREAYSFALENSGLTTREFEDSIRKEAASTVLQSALIATMTPPAIFGTTLYQYIAEERRVEFVTLSVDDLETPPSDPTDAEVRAYYEDNPEPFTLPERKAITYAWLAPDDLRDQVEVSEDDMRALYEDRAILYDRPERRMISRLGFSDQAAADAARAALEAGETTFDDLVTERGLTEADVDLGTFSADGLDTNVAEAVFGLEDNGVVGPLDTNVGPALFQMNAILQASFTPFEEALDELRADLAMDQARRFVDQEVEPVDDLLAGGATLEEIVDETALSLGQIEWSPGTPATEMPAALPEFQELARAIKMDDFAELTTTQTGIIFAMRLDRVIPPELQPLDDVRDLATERAAAAKVRDVLNERAEVIETALNGGQSFADQEISPTSVGGITRQSLAMDLPLPLLSDVYDMDVGDVQVIEDGATVHVVQMVDLLPADTSASEAQQLLTQLNVETGRAMADDMLTIFARAISTDVGIRLDQAAIDAVHNNFR